MSQPLAVILASALGAACGGAKVVDPPPVPDDYQGWYRLETFGPVPGHGDTYRIIYANDTARLRGAPVFIPGVDASPDDLDGGSGDKIETTNQYPEGSIIVKEVYERDGDQPGAIKYLGVMRKLAEAPSGAQLKYPSDYSDAGWLFTYLAEDIQSDEEYRSSCWDECHAAAPIDGAFYDFAQ